MTNYQLSFESQRRFVCRSVEYNYITTKCHLSEHDRRSVDEFVELIDAQGVDYFENLCLKSKCKLTFAHGKK